MNIPLPAFFDVALGNNDVPGSDSFGDARLFAGFVGVSASIASVLIDGVIGALASSSSWQREA
jgi:hypothetical protein